MKLWKNDSICLFVLCYLFLLVTGVQACNSGMLQDNTTLTTICDSLEAIQYPATQIKEWKPQMIIIIKSQEDWGSINNKINGYLREGKCNILVDVRVNNICFDKGLVFSNLNYPKANIRIIGSNAKIHANEYIYKRKNGKKYNGFYYHPYPNFGLSDLFIDEKGNEIPLREQVFEIDKKIEEVTMFGKTYFKKFGTDKTDSITKIWRFPISMSDLTEEECKDFYILLTRDWISCRHPVYKVEGGFLYFYMDSPDFMSSVTPNCDKEKYNVNPRIRLINSPISTGLHYKNGVLYVPSRYNSIRAVKGYRLLTLTNCVFNSFEISGFSINGSGDGSVIDINNCRFKEAMLIRNNQFRNLSNLAIFSSKSENICVTGNEISNTRVGAIQCSGVNTTINNNHLQYIGWMLNTRAIIGGGEYLHVCNNSVEDFYYAAITTGSVASNKKAVKLTYIIERNLIRQNKKYTDNYLYNSLADGGGMYIGPQCTQGIIRHNVVVNMKGIYSNRGIFLDDGAKNLSVYGNLICNTSNCYDIDLRLCHTYANGIPDHNNNNTIFNNILTGGYRFQDAGLKSNCTGGQNILLGLSPFLKYDVSLSYQVKDIVIKGSVFKDEKLFLDRANEAALDSLRIDGFVRRFIEFK